MDGGAGSARSASAMPRTQYTTMSNTQQSILSQWIWEQKMQSTQKNNFRAEGQGRGDSCVSWPLPARDLNIIGQMYYYLLTPLYYSLVQTVVKVDLCIVSRQDGSAQI